MAWIGVDLGTQSVRAVLVDDAGAVLRRAARPLTSRREADRHEQDPYEWFAAVEQVLAEVSASDVQGLAICSTSGTVLLTDRRGRPVTPALMYDDARAGALVPRIVDADPGRWSTAMQPTWALPKILWLAPEDRLVAHSADAVAAHLTGHPVATDTSHVLKSGFDLTAGPIGAWPTAALDKLGLTTDVLPDVVLPGTEIGRLSAAKAEVTGLPVGTPIRAGMTDGCAAQLAAGALTPGAWNSVLGTTLVLKGVTTTLLDDPTGAVYSHRHPDGGWLPGGASNTGAGALTTMLPGADLAALDRAAVDRAARNDGVPIDAVVYPLTKRGERFPFVAPEAEGFTIGDIPDELHRYIAVQQGVAFIERLAFDHLAKLEHASRFPACCAALGGHSAALEGEARRTPLRASPSALRCTPPSTCSRLQGTERHAPGADPLTSVSLTGGAVNSEHWNQLRADVLGVPVELPAVPDPAYGMAVLAASAGTSVTETAARMVRTARVIEPRPQPRLTDLYSAFVAELDRRGYRR